MDYQTGFIIGYVLTLFVVVVVTLLWSFIRATRAQIKNTQHALRDLTTALGYEYRTDAHSKRIYVGVPWGNTNNLPVRQGQINEAFKEHNETEAALYKFLGISYSRKVSPVIPSKVEVLFTKTGKK